MSGTPFKYIKQPRTMHGKFSKSLSKKSFESKNGTLRSIPPYLPNVILKVKSKLFYFFQRIMFLACRMFLILFLTWQAMSGAPFKYIKHGHTMYENFLRACQKNVLSQKCGFLKHTTTGMLHRAPFLTQNISLTSS